MTTANSNARAISRPRRDNGRKCLSKIMTYLRGKSTLYRAHTAACATAKRRTGAARRGYHGGQLPKAP